MTFTYCFSCVFLGYANFFKSPQTANSQILGFPPLSQIRKFLRCASLQIANPPIFMIYQQIADSSNFYKILHNTVSKVKTVLKVAFIKKNFILYFEPQYCFLYLQGENVCICGLAELKVRKHKKMLVRKSAKCHICGGSANLTNDIIPLVCRFRFAELICGSPTYVSYSLPSRFFVLISSGLPYIFRDRLTGPYLRWDGRKTIPQGSKPYCYTV
jgi:hypothetical protein